MQQIFISYSRKDIAFVRKLAGDLESAGYDVWWDVSDLRGGDDWVRNIPAAIEASEFFIVVLSPNSIISDWVRKEYTQALSLRKKVIPVMLEKSSVPFALNTLNYIDFTTGEYVTNLKSLLTTLEYTGELPRPAQTLPLRKYAIPMMLALAVVMALFANFFFAPVPPAATATTTPTSLPSNTPVVLPTNTVTSAPSATLTITSTVSLTPTLTVTETNTPPATSTAIPSATNQPFDVLIYCVNSLYANSINVRSGPGTIYAPTGEPLQVGKCLGFSAQNPQGTWLQVAPVQTDSNLQQYAGGWIFRELLGLGKEGPIDLPAVTLTPTPTPSNTPTITPTFPDTPSPTVTETLLPTDTATPASG